MFFLCDQIGCEQLPPLDDAQVACPLVWSLVVSRKNSRDLMLVELQIHILPRISPISHHFPSSFLHKKPRHPCQIKLRFSRSFLGIMHDELHS